MTRITIVEECQNRTDGIPQDKNDTRINIQRCPVRFYSYDLGVVFVAFQWEAAI